MTRSASGETVSTVGERGTDCAIEPTHIAFLAKDREVVVDVLATTLYVRRNHQDTWRWRDVALVHVGQWGAPDIWLFADEDGAVWRYRDEDGYIAVEAGSMDAWLGARAQFGNARARARRIGPGSDPPAAAGAHHTWCPIERGRRLDHAWRLWTIARRPMSRAPAVFAQIRVISGRDVDRPSGNERKSH